MSIEGKLRISRHATYVVVVVMVVGTAAEDDGDELMPDSSDSDDCVGVTDAAWSLELGVYEPIETVELALL